MAKGKKKGKGKATAEAEADVDVDVEASGDAFEAGQVPEVVAEEGEIPAEVLALLAEAEPELSPKERTALAERLRLRGLLPRKITAAQRQKLAARREKFLNETVLGRGELTQMPTGDLKHRRAFNATLEFLYDVGRVFTRLQQLEVEVTARAKESGRPKPKILVELLDDLEARNGFKPAIDLPAQALDGPAWSEMLRGGALFNDVVFNDEGRGGNPHAMLTHRLQWAVLMLELAWNPKPFATKGEVPSAAELFVELGRKRESKLDWSDTGINSNPNKTQENRKLLWFVLFDAWDTAFTSPEAMRGTHEAWPDVGDWV